MSQSLLLSEEQHRILRSRIVDAIENARYFPAAVHAVSAADHCLRFPFTPEPHNSGRTNGNKD